MNISMTGIDHEKASVQERELFAPAKSVQVALTQKIKSYSGINGCVILHTCNRTELWISTEEPCSDDAYDVFCRALNIDCETYRSLFVQRHGSEAVTHLFELASGLKSKVFGEDQIISQVNDAICFAREHNTSDAVLEVLFRNAVTAAKKAKTEVCLTAVDRSVAKVAVDLLNERYGRSMEGVSCLVVGNGAMGRLAAKYLQEEGCDVFMTLRRYKHAEVIIPYGCKTIDYRERYRKMADVSVVISATTSPHFTVRQEDVSAFIQERDMLFFDLAVPRDIDPRIGELPNVTLYDIDVLGADLRNDGNNETIKRVKIILHDAIKEFEDWYYIREFLPKIEEISTIIALDIENRMKHSLKDITLDENSREYVCASANRAAQKVVGKMIFGLRKNMTACTWEDYLNCLSESSIK